MSRFDGVGPRIRERLLALGYVQPNGKPDVSRFSKDFRFDKVYVHRWVNDEMTPHKELDRLVEILQCSKSWLIFGEGPAPAKPRRVRTISGGSADHPTPSVDDAASGVPLIGRCRAAWVHWWYGAPIWSPMPAWA